LHLTVYKSLSNHQNLLQEEEEENVDRKEE
jgi:hypothetical protein